MIYVSEYPDYVFITTTAGFSFGIGYASIQGGKIELDHKNNILEKARTVPGFVWLTSVCGPLINIFWLLYFVGVSSSPIFALMFD